MSAGGYAVAARARYHRRMRRIISFVLLVACNNASSSGLGPSVDASIHDDVAAMAPRPDGDSTRDAPLDERDGPGADATATDAAMGADAGPMTPREQYAAHCVRCTGGACTRLSACYSAWWRAEGSDEYFRCRVEGGCASRDDPCAARALGAVAVSAEGMAFATACAARQTECGGRYQVCMATFGSLLSDTSRAAYSECLTRPCPEVANCLSNARPSVCSGS